uniref:Uncharacterized protein n=1 Tax=Panagrolaimus sp. JU765 TaxID=591449 RepID=A0AC34RFF9_9BILA
MINHGYELVYKQFPDLNDTSEMKDEIGDANVVVKQCVTKVNESCFTIEPPPKIQCYDSRNATFGSPKECDFYATRCRYTRSKATYAVTRRDCSPANIAFDDSKEKECYETADSEVCDIKGNLSNNYLPEEKNCWTGIEGDCKPFFNHEIGQAFFHKPKETYCREWDKGCFKAVLNGTCTWYACHRFSDNYFYQQENIQYNYTRIDNNAIVFPVDHYRCVEENCNTPKDSATDLSSNLALMLLALGMLNVLE